jgi:hypothetical protein
MSSISAPKGALFNYVENYCDCLSNYVIISSTIDVYVIISYTREAGGILSTSKEGIMGRRGTAWSLEKERRRIKEGRGTGEGAGYKPWITTHDFPSKGQVCRAKGQTTGRIHHMMSSLERDLFLILDYDPDVTDIREQYPLKLEDTLLIAARCSCIIELNKK